MKLCNVIDKAIQCLKITPLSVVKRDVELAKLTEFYDPNLSESIKWLDGLFSPEDCVNTIDHDKGVLWALAIMRDPKNPFLALPGYAESRIKKCTAYLDGVKHFYEWRDQNAKQD